MAQLLNPGSLSGGIGTCLGIAAVVLLACPGPDRVAPTVSIVEPAPGDTVQGTVSVRVHATDNRGVTEVRLLVDGEPAAVASEGRRDTFLLSWNSATLALDTLHTLACVGLDAAENSDTSEPVVVFVRSGARHQGAVLADEVWEARDNPHVVGGELVVRARLTLAAGVVVRMSVGSGFSVGAGGVLQALGASDSRVVVSSAGRSPGPGDWQGIVFIGAGPDSNVLRHCVLSHGGGNGHGLLWCRGVPVAVESCSLLASSSNGLVLEGCSLSVFSGNHFGGCARFPVFAEPEFAGTVGANNTWVGNGYDGIGVAGGTVSRSTDWRYSNAPFYVTGTIDVAGPARPVFRIASGCSLLFADSARVRVGVGQPGVLVVEGAGSPVVFSGFPGELYWPGIEFWPETDPGLTSLRRCVVERAGAGGIAAVTCYAQVALCSVEVRRSAAAGIACRGVGFSSFSGNVVTDSCAGYPLSIEAEYVGSLGSGNRLAGNSVDSVEVLGGSVGSNARWQDQGVPYLVKGRVYVGSKTRPIVTLTIDPGVTLAFLPDAGLTVGDADHKNGAISATGVPDSIVFTGARAEPGAWRGVELLSLSLPSVIDHCRILYGGGAGLGILLVSGEYNAPQVTNNEIAYSPNYCIALIEDPPLDPDSLRLTNWLHDWGLEDIHEGGD